MNCWVGLVFRFRDLRYLKFCFDFFEFYLKINF